MISFPKLGQYGRLGNQLFQYAYLRSMARRLNTTFYCPQWDGDGIFELNDATERSGTPDGITRFYDPAPEAGFTPAALAIGDGTEVQGFFQSEQYYPDKGAVREWYRFRASVVAGVAGRFANELQTNCASLSLRLDGDYGATREYFPLYPPAYYEAALRKAGGDGPVLVFADRPDLAREFLKPLRQREFVHVTDLNGPQQLFLMTQCRTNIITNSTFAWWGAWLNSHPERIAIAPAEWCRAGVPNAVAGILCDDWIRIRGTRPVWDHFQVWRLRHPVATFRRAWRKWTDR